MTAWHEDEPEDLNAAQPFSGVQFGPDDYRFDGDVQAAYDSLLHNSNHWNLLIALNCKFEAHCLEERAIQHWIARTRVESGNP